jgi:hypothetical protein
MFRNVFRTWENISYFHLYFLYQSSTFLRKKNSNKYFLKKLRTQEHQQYRASSMETVLLLNRTPSRNKRASTRPMTNDCVNSTISDQSDTDESSKECKECFCLTK